MSDQSAYHAYRTGDPAIGGFIKEEAVQCIEFAIELNNQDDRLADPKRADYIPRIDPALWDPVPVFDSRHAVAEDTARYKAGQREGLAPWRKVYERAMRDADRKYPGGWDAGTIFKDPDLNGFGPWKNAWLLYQGRGRYAGSFAIVIRGTVLSDAPNVLEDFLFQPVKTRAFLSPHVRFAEAPRACVHGGFAHATFGVLLDDRYGVLRALAEKVPTKARLYIVGHSQGAGMAALTHAFLHYALNHDRAGPDTFGLKDCEYTLKSYFIALPKPGNYSFAADFARYTQAADNAIVIDNNIDPVPKVPLTLETMADLGEDFRASTKLGAVIYALSGAGRWLRHTLSAIAEPFVRESAEGYGYFYRYRELELTGRRDEPGSSWNFQPVGRIFHVYGTPGDPHDYFLQHHAWTYRNLVAAQL
jgi:hypothetical protein